MTEPRDPNEPRPPLDDDWFTPFDDATSEWPDEDLTTEPFGAESGRDQPAPPEPSFDDETDAFAAEQPGAEAAAAPDAEPPPDAQPAPDAQLAPDTEPATEELAAPVPEELTAPPMPEVEAAPVTESEPGDVADAAPGSTQPPVQADAVPPVVQLYDPGQPWDTKRWGDRRRPTTAEQAVPWLVGLVLALSGIIIVLLVLIFSEANGGFAASSSGSPSLSLASQPEATPTAAVSASASATASASASASTAPTPRPKYGALEMMYLARPTALAASELVRNDFASTTPETIVDRSSADVARYALASDGTVAVAIVGGKLLALQPGKPVRTLASAADTATFGADASTVYAVKVTRSGTSDSAVITAITFRTGAAKNLATITYGHPGASQLSTLDAARFADDGGTYRIYSTTDGNLVFWVANGGQWRVDPVSGAKIAASRPPILWSPDGSKRISIGRSGALTTLAVVDSSGSTSARVTVTGMVSHLRWSPSGSRVVFTLGRTLPGGGVRQDLYLWDLVNDHAPTALTGNGASFGADWLGAAQFWQP